MNPKEQTTLLTLKEIIFLTKRSKSSIYLAMKNSDFPESIKLSTRSVAWTTASVDLWMQSRIEGKTYQQILREQGQGK